jgi:hypothetical protein
LAKEIKLTQGFVALVSDEDYEELSQYKWFANVVQDGYVYAIRNSCRKNGKKNKIIKMHRHILGVTDNNILVDHCDRNTLNNQRANLRKATPSQNNANAKSHKNSTSKYRGVHLTKTTVNGRLYNYWRACIYNNGERFDLGSFKTEVEAAEAVNMKSREMHGEFANINIIE